LKEKILSLWEKGLRSELSLIGLAALISLLVAGSFIILPVKWVLILVLSIIFFTVSFLNLGLGLMILIFSMLFSPEISIGGILPGAFRSFTLRFEDLLLIILFLSFLAQLALRKDITLTNTPLYLPLGTFLLIQSISTWMGAGRGRVQPISGTFFILKEIEFWLIFFVVVNYVRTKRQIINFIIIFFLITALVGVYGLSQVGKVRRIAAPFDAGEANTLGGYLVLAYSFIIAMFFYVRSNKLKSLLVIMGAVLFVPFLNTLSRGSYLALALTLLVFSLLLKNWGLIIFSLVVIATSPFWAPEQVAERVAYTFSGYGSYPFGSSVVDRILMWKRAIRLWLMHPFLGNGVTGVWLVDNHYLRILGETGVFGLLAFFWLLGTIFRCAFRLFISSKDRLIHCFTAGYIAGFLGILVHAITADTFYIVRIMEPFCFLTGIMMALYMKKTQIEGIEEEILPD